MTAMTFIQLIFRLVD